MTMEELKFSKNIIPLVPLGKVAVAICILPFKTLVKHSLKDLSKTMSTNFHTDDGSLNGSETLMSRV